MGQQPPRTEFDDASAAREARLIDCAVDQIKAVKSRERGMGAPMGTPFGGEMPPADTFTGYELVREIHRGGQGVVYQARQQSTNRMVAIKVMREGPFGGPKDKARFDREVQILGLLKHRNIVTIHDSGSSAGHVYFVMDFIGGQPLDVHVMGRARAPDEILALFAKICDAVQAAHACGVVHRDIKPSNIRVDDGGEPHMLDFGMAKTATGGDEEKGVTVTASGQFIGSLPWASPEHAAGTPEKIDARSDVYALGVVLYQMLTGRFPYDVVGPMHDVLGRIIDAQPTPPRSHNRRLDDEIETIVLRCLAKDPQRRYQTAGELAQDIRRYLAGEPIEAKRDSSLYVLRKYVGRHRAVATSLASLFLVVFGASILLLIMYRGQTRARADAEREATTARMTSDLLAGILEGVDPRKAQGEDLTVREMLDSAADRVGHELNPNPIVEAALRETMGRAYSALGRYSDGVAHFRRALELRQRLHGVDSPEANAVLIALAATIHQYGALDEAIPMYREALARTRTHFGSDSLESVEALSNLGLALTAKGQFDQAIEMQEESIRLFRLHGKTETPQFAVLLTNLALSHYRLGDLHGATRPLSESLEIKRRLLPETHPDLVRGVANVGQLLSDQRRLDEAEPYLLEAVEMRRRVLGDHHPELAVSLNSLGSLYILRGDYAKAEPFCREGLAICRAGLDPNNPQLVESLNSMARIALEVGRHGEAESLATEAVAVARANLPIGHDSPETPRDPRLAVALTTLGQVQRRAKSGEPEPHFREALDNLTNANTDSLRARRALVLINLAGHLCARGDADDAEPLLAEATELLGPLPEIYAAERAALARERGACLTAVGRFSEAAAILDSALEQYATLYGDDHPHVAAARTLLEAARTGARAAD